MAFWLDDGVELISRLPLFKTHTSHLNDASIVSKSSGFQVHHNKRQIGQ
jgi:hypothetical protein